MHHLLVHPITIPLNFEVFVQARQPELLQGAEGLNALRDLIQLLQGHNVQAFNAWKGAIHDLYLVDIRHLLQYKRL